MCYNPVNEIKIKQFLELETDNLSKKLNNFHTNNNGTASQEIKVSKEFIETKRKNDFEI